MPLEREQNYLTTMAQDSRHDFFYTKSQEWFFEQQFTAPTELQIKEYHYETQWRRLRDYVRGLH